MNQPIEVLLRKESSETIGVTPSIGIFINDVKKVINEFSKPFRPTGFRCINSPTNKGFFPDENTEKRIIHFMTRLRQTMTTQELEKVGVVVIDQFYDWPDAWGVGDIFLSYLRTVNNTAWIVETSAAPRYRPVYSSGNVVLDNADINEVISLVNKSPPNIVSRLKAFQTFTHNEMVEAQRADPDKKGEKYDPIHGLNKLLISNMFETVLRMYGLSVDQLIQLFNEADYNNKCFIIHHLGTIITQMKLGRPKEEYSMSISRLNNILFDLK